MANYSYVAIDPHGLEARGVLEVASQREAIRRVREMGLFPTKIKENFEPPSRRLFAGECHVWVGGKAFGVRTVKLEPQA
jgi:type II secretory pathway component PulF